MNQHDHDLDRPSIEIPPVTTTTVGTHYDVVGDEVDVEEEVGGLNISAAQEETRARIALHFTKVFLLLVAMSLLVPFIIHLALPQTIPQPIETAKELVTVLASILAGPFGFIVGFYFKQGTD